MYFLTFSFLYFMEVLAWDAPVVMSSDVSARLFESVALCVASTFVIVIVDVVCLV